MWGVRFEIQAFTWFEDEHIWGTTIYLSFRSLDLEYRQLAGLRVVRFRVQSCTWCEGGGFRYNYLTRVRVISFRVHPCPWSEAGQVWVLVMYIV